eukprot:4754552-Pyramimonas_sp.AAC.1
MLPPMLTTDDEVVCGRSAWAWGCAGGDGIGLDSASQPQGPPVCRLLKLQQLQCPQHRAREPQHQAREPRH